MDSAVIAAIVSVLGAGFLAMLFFFMRGIRADIADLRSEIRSLRAEMQAEFAAVRGEMRSEFAAVRGEMQAEFAAVRAEMQAEFAAVRGEMRSDFAAVRGEMQGMRSDISALQQTVARHDGILTQIGHQNGTAAG